MAGAYVQEWEYNASSTQTSRTLTVSGATANNLLVGMVSVRAGGASFTTPTGWTLIETGSDAGPQMGSACYYRIASGTSADDFACSWTDGGRPGLLVQEYSGLDSTSPFEDSGEDEAELGDSTAKSISSGSATPSTTNGLAIAMFGLRVGSEWTAATSSVSNSFTKQGTRQESANGENQFATKVYTSTAAQTSTLTTTGTGGESYGAIAVFKEPGGGGGPTIPIFDHHYRMTH